MQGISLSTGSLGAMPTEALSSVATSKIDEAKAAAADGKHDEAALSFETLLATMLVKEMRKAMPEGFFGDGAGSDVYGGWLDEHLGSALAERDSLGFAGMVKEDLVRLQAAQEADAS